MSSGFLNVTRHLFLADDDQSTWAVTFKKQTQKDHPLLGATLRTQNALSGLRSLEFEGFPPELRLRIYRLLLVDYVSVARFDDLHKTDKPRPVFWHRYDRPLFPAILQSNKFIHREACAVLYGENAFSWLVHGVMRTTIWHLPSFGKTFLPQHYSRLITKIRLFVSIEFLGPLRSSDDFPIVEGYLSEFSTKLALNDLRFVKVDVDYPRAWLERTVTSTVLEERKSAVQRCLAPLIMVRADRFSMESGNAMLDCGSALQAEIEGPKDDEFLLRRQQEENDAESMSALGNAEPDGRV